MTFFLRLDANDQIQIDGELFSVLDQTGTELRLKSAKASEPAQTHVRTRDEIFELYHKGKLKITRMAPRPQRLPEGTKELLSVHAITLPEAAQEEMHRRLEYVTQCDKIFSQRPRDRAVPMTPEGFAVIAAEVAAFRRQREAECRQCPIDEVALEHVPSGSTVRGWYYRWRDAGRQANALLPLHHRKGSRAPKLAKPIQKIIEEMVRRYWLTPERPPVTVIHQLIAARILAGRWRGKKAGSPAPIPSLMAVHRFIAKAIPLYEQKLRRYGPQAAAAVTRTRSVSKVGVPLQVVEVDHTILDLQLVIGPGPAGQSTDDMSAKPRKKPASNRSGSKSSGSKIVLRPTLTVAIDVATRMIVGFNLDFHKPSYWSVMKCLGMGFKPKQFLDLKLETPWPVEGIPDILKLDNGKEFHSISMRAAAARLGIELRYCAPGRPQSKPHIERFFGNVARDFCAGLPGRTFSGTHERGEYKPMERASLTIEQVRVLFTRWVVNCYHNQKHRGLGKSPLERWRELSGFGVRLAPEPADLIDWLGLVVKSKVSEEGISFLGLNYNSKDLQRLDKKGDIGYIQPLIRLDPGDLTKIVVIQGTTRLEVPNTQGIKDLDLGMWQEILAKRAWDKKKAMPLEIVASTRADILSEARRGLRRARKATNWKDLAFWAHRESEGDVTYDVAPYPASQ